MFIKVKIRAKRAKLMTYMTLFCEEIKMSSPKSCFRNNAEIKFQID